MNSCPGATVSVTRSSTRCMRPRRETMSTRSCGFRRSARASRGFISTQAFGDSRSRIGTFPVLVRVCQCSTVRPVFSTNGNSLFGCSGNGSQVHRDQPRAAVVGLKPSVGVEPARLVSGSPCRPETATAGHRAARWPCRSCRSSRRDARRRSVSTPRTRLPALTSQERSRLERRAHRRHP